MAGLTPVGGLEVAQLRLDAASEAPSDVSAETLAAAHAALDEARAKMGTLCHSCGGTGFVSEWRPGGGGMCRCGTGASDFDPR